MSRAILTTVAGAIALVLVSALIGCATVAGPDANLDRIERDMRWEPYVPTSRASRGIAVEPTALVVNATSRREPVRYRRYYVPAQARRIASGRVDHRSRRAGRASKSAAAH